MSADPNKWHVVILTEDPAYKDLATGFRRELPQPVQRQVTVENPPGGGRTVLYERAKELVSEPEEKRIVIVLTDFDSKLKTEDASSMTEDADNESIRKRTETFDEIREQDDSARTFVIGPLMEAEDLVCELAPMLPAKNRQDVTPVTSEVRCGQLFGSADLKCDAAIWQCRQLRHAYNRAQLDELCGLLQRKVVAESKGAHVE